MAQLNELFKSPYNSPLLALLKQRSCGVSQNRVHDEIPAFAGMTDLIW